MKDSTGYVLGTRDHSRDVAGLKYVYPVLSRRSGGLSVGINLNPNNACNWRCIYCQVPDLQLGAASPVNVELLHHELLQFLTATTNGQQVQFAADETVQPGVRDIAISGNGEPTSCRELPEVIDAIADVLTQRSLLDSVKLVIITNGSLISQSHVGLSLNRWGALGGEIWFKLDRVTREGLSGVNNASISPERIRENLRRATQSCRTWVQTSVFNIDGLPPPEQDVRAYLNFLNHCLAEQMPIAGVLLYGLARPSLQPEASHLTPVSEQWLAQFATAVRALGLVVNVNE